MRKKVLIYVFTNSRRYYWSSHSQQQVTVRGWLWPAEPHLKLMGECTISSRNSRDIQGVPMYSSCLTLRLPGLWMSPAGPAGLSGQSPCWSGEVGGGRTDLAASAHPALQPHQHLNLNAGKQHCCFCLDDFASWCSSDRHSELCTPGSCSTGDHQKGCCALCDETCSSWHSTLQPAWLQMGLLGMLHPYPVVLSQLIDEEYQHHGPFSPAPWRLSHSWSDQLLTLSMSPPQLLNTRTRRA